MADNERGPQPPTPELDRRSAVLATGAPQHVTDFLNWLDGQGVYLARSQHIEGYRDPQFVPWFPNRESMLEEHFGLDSDKIEAERRALLDWLAKAPRA